MLDINLIKENPELVQVALAKRGITNIDLNQIIALDTNKRELLRNNEDIRAKRNQLSTDISKITDKAQREKIILQVQQLKQSLAQSDNALAKVEQELFQYLVSIPNIVAPDTVAGGKEANVAIKTFGKKPEFTFKPLDHVTLCTNLGLVDYDRGIKMSGSGHWVYTGPGAQLEWALLNYFIDFHTANKYTFIMPPHILNYESGYAAGQFPKYTDEVFLLSLGKNEKSNPQREKFLLPTSETALINMHRDEIISCEKLPIKYFAYSPCYRGEAGGYGAGERGMIRGHQFNKIEMFMFSTPDTSFTLLDELVQNAEKLVEGLGLHYQTVKLAAGDTGPVMAKTYDVEVYIPSLGYKEVSSCSNALDYQARRANIKYKVCKNGESTQMQKTQYLHTLNASGLATSRLIPAIVEQFQNPDGSVTIPLALRKYMGGLEIIHKKTSDAFKPRS